MDLPMCWLLEEQVLTKLENYIPNTHNAWKQGEKNKLRSSHLWASQGDKLHMREVAIGINLPWNWISDKSWGKFELQSSLGCGVFFFAKLGMDIMTGELGKDQTKSLHLPDITKKTLIDWAHQPQRSNTVSSTGVPVAMYSDVTGNHPWKKIAHPCKEQCTTMDHNQLLKKIGYVLCCIIAFAFIFHFSLKASKRCTFSAHLLMGSMIHFGYDATVLSMQVKFVYRHIAPLMTQNNTFLRGTVHYNGSQQSTPLQHYRLLYLCLDPLFTDPINMFYLLICSPYIFWG